MSIKVCSRLIPSLLRHTNCKQIPIVHNCSALYKNSGYVVSSNLNNLLHSVRFVSTTKNKQNPESTAANQKVYYGILTPQIRAVKLFSLLTSFAGLAAQPFMYKEITSLGSVPLMVVACSFIGLFTIVTPILLHLITKKYITALTYKPETGTYVASTLNFFIMEKQLEFKPDDVKVPDVLGMFTSFLIKGKPLFLDPRLFEDPSHYGKIMGYDKPLDLKLYETSWNEKKNK